MKKVNIILILIISAGLALRLWRVDLPLLEFYPSRQIQTADIARNFYKYDLPITKPAVSYLGQDLTPFLVEFPGYNFAIAQVYRIIGSADEVIGRLFSIIGWLVSVYFLFQLAKRYVGEKAALISSFFYTFSPLSILISRSFQPDQWMLTVSLAAIYFLASWHRRRELLFYLSATLASIALLLKTPAVIFILIPAAFLLKSKKVELLSPKSITYFGIALLPPVVWYLYVTYVNRMGEVLKESVVLANWFGFEIFLNPKYYSNLFGFEYNLVLLPVGMVLFLIGLSSKLRREQFILYIWLASITFYFVIFNKHNMTHEYYHLPFLPIAAIFIGLGFVKVTRSFRDLIIPKNLSLATCFLLLVVMMLPPTLGRAYKPIERFSYVLETAEVIQKLTKPDDLIIGSMDAGPSLVYYSDRRGWPFEIDRKNTAETLAFYGVGDKKVVDPIEDLEQMRSNGATIFAAASKDQFLENDEFAKYMYGSYRVLVETDNYIIFDLNSPD